MNVGTLVARAARRHGAAVALEEPRAQRSFAEVGQRVARLAHGLRDLGLESGDRVLDLQSNGITYVETDFGIASAGLCRVALNYRLSPTDWGRIAEDCRPTALIYRAEFADRIAPLQEFVSHTICIGDGDGIPYEELLARASDEPVEQDIDADQLISLNYSSGTTGRPKGARRTHRNRIASLQNIIADIMVPNPSDVWCHAGPITHASGLFVLPNFFLGARQYILPTFDPDALIDAFEHRGVTGTVLVPTMVARVLANGRMSQAKTRRLRRLVYAGAPMPPEQIRETFSRVTPNLVQMYGLVEAIPPVTFLTPQDHAIGIESKPELLSAAGYPCLGVELRVVDEARRDVPVGEVGEVISRGDHIMSGYWGDEDATAAKAVVDGWLHTGDLGRLDEDGRLYLVDRKGEMIISGGYNIYPREIEDTIAMLPGVAEVAVVGVQDPEWGQRVVALYSVREGAAVTPDDVLEHCKAHVASYKKPKEIRIVASFPLQATGKISKKQLRADLEAGAGRP